MMGVVEKLEKLECSIGILHWGNYNPAKSDEYGYKVINGYKEIEFFVRSDFNSNQILEFLEAKKPEIIVVSGWMDKGYLLAARKYKKIFPNVKIVTAIDDIWHGSLRQKLGTLFYKIFLSSIFDFHWVAGTMQYHYSRMFGVPHDRIINFLYSANFKSQSRSIEDNFAKRFIYVGRLEESKGVMPLINAHKSLPKGTRSEFPLVIIGSGSLQSKVEECLDDNIEFHSFMQHDALQNELKKGGIGCIPSYLEAWGVVIHEFIQNSMPILVSDCCGANIEIFIDSYNGFSFKAGNITNLTEKLFYFSQMSEDELINMASNGLELSVRFNSSFSAHSLLSILNMDIR